MKFHSGLCLAFLFSINAYGDDSILQERIDAAQVEGSVIKLSALVDKCETLWPSNATLYFQSENKVGEALEVLAKTNSAAVQELESQAKIVLGKHCPEGARAANACLKSKFQIAERFVNITAAAPDFHGAKILAKFLGEVRTTLNTNYHFTLMSANVMPPIAPKGQGVFTGMDPNAISDPVARAAYLKAIDKNAQIGDENDLQLHTLPEINRTMTSYFIRYTKELFAQNSEAKSEANNLATLAHLTQNEQQQLQ
jgi:hypothetical protein